MLRLSILAISFLLFFTSCGPKEKKNKSEGETAFIDATKEEIKPKVDFPIYDYEGLEPLLNRSDDKTYIVNFWATWCKPCIEEMPYFEKVYAEQKENNVELVLVSLDMPSMWESRLVSFVKKKDLKGAVVILDDPKMNDWIPKIDKDWSGGIPATLIYNNEQRAFYAHGFTYEELNTELQKFINP